MITKEKVYKTDNLALAPYLFMEGLKYIGCDVESKDNNTYKIVFCFNDEKGVGSDLALEFSKSRERQYKTTWSFFRNQIEEQKGQIRKGKTKCLNS